VSRLQRTFDHLRSEGRKGLVAYVSGGDPDFDQSLAVLNGLARGGADVIEIGVPFSDPIADGPVIQRASERALAAGGGLLPTLELARQLRERSDVPVVLFTYLNPVLRRGFDDFAARAAAAGVDGVLVLDLPIEESSSTSASLRGRGLDQIFLVSPTTTDERIREAGRHGRGFLYAISRLGVTGATVSVATSAEPLVRRIRAATDTPVALGFGISHPDHVREVQRYADAAVVGSALVDAIDRAAKRGEDLERAAATYIAWLRGDGRG
jgi:tryptophan synthase alpha chain